MRGHIKEKMRGHKLHVWNSHQFSCIKTNGKKFREKFLNQVIPFSSGLEFTKFYAYEIDKEGGIVSFFIDKNGL